MSEAVYFRHKLAIWQATSPLPSDLLDKRHTTISKSPTSKPDQPGYQVSSSLIRSRATPQAWLGALASSLPSRYVDK